MYNFQNSRKGFFADLILHQDSCWISLAFDGGQFQYNYDFYVNYGYRTGKDRVIVPFQPASKEKTELIKEDPLNNHKENLME